LILLFVDVPKIGGNREDFPAETETYCFSENVIVPSRLPKDLRSFITPFLRSHSPLPICPQMNATWIDIGFYWILIDKLLHQHHETSFPIQNQFESPKIKQLADCRKTKTPGMAC